MSSSDDPAGGPTPDPSAPTTDTTVEPVPARRRPAKKAATKATVAKRTPANRSASKAIDTLCIDVGGSGVKGATVGSDGTMRSDLVRLDTTYPLPPEGLLDMIAEIGRRSPAAQRVAIGFPGMVRVGEVLSAPHFVTASGPGSQVVPDLRQRWHRFALSAAVNERLGLPTRLANDADTQGLAAIEGKGLELVITLGTGIGTAIFLDGELGPHIELSHHPLTKKRTYNEYVGERARKSTGNKTWSKRVQHTVDVLSALTFYDRLYVGGGNASKLTRHFTHDATRVENADGILGGARLWNLQRVP